MFAVVELLGFWLGGNITRAPAIGGTPLELEVYALHTGEFAGSNKVLEVVGTHEMLNSVSASVTPGEAPVYPGVMFDLFVKRQTNIEGFDFATSITGDHVVWAYMREGSFVSHESGHISDQGWKPLNQGGTTVIARTGRHVRLRFR